MSWKLPRFAPHAVLALTVVSFCAPSARAGTAPVIGLHENTPNVAALTNARIVVRPGTVVETGTVVIRDGRIESVGVSVPVPPDAVIRDCAGLTVYAGFVDIYTRYGLSNASSGDGAGARHWNAHVHPEFRAADVFAPDEKAAEKLRKWGITAAAAFPGDGIFRGAGALVLTSEDTPNETVLIDDIGQSLSFRKPGGGYPNSLMGSVALIRQTLSDADWYRLARDLYAKSPAGQDAPETNVSLAALAAHESRAAPYVFETRDGLDIFRAAGIIAEFGLPAWIVCSGYEYRRLEAVKKTGARLVVPVNFPDAPDVSTDETTLRDLRHWDFAPENPGRLSSAGIDIALTSAFLDDDADFLANVRTAVKRGLSNERALAALTVIPARWLGAEHLLGSVEKGGLANLVVADGCVFEDGTKIISTWVAGKRHEVTAVPDVDIRGVWSFEMTPGRGTPALTLDIGGERAAPTVKIAYGEKTIKALKTTLRERIFTTAFPADSLGFGGVVRINGIVEETTMTGRGSWVDGSGFAWRSSREKPFEAKEDTTKAEPAEMAAFSVVYPDGAFGRPAPPVRPDAVLVKNATIWTCGPGGVLENADMLVVDGRIESVGTGLSAPSGAVVIDAAGLHVTPGLIDAHSHLAVSRGVSEGTHSITAEVRIRDVIDSDDINIYRQLAGGLTAACLLHGSANTIGGQNEVVKLRWGDLPGGMICGDARPSIKFALGENVKRSNVTGPPTTRYPRTRMGVEQFIRDSFRAAKDYRRGWKEYADGVTENPNLVPPRKNLRYEALLEVLDGERQVQCHSYRQDEILAIMRAAEDIGFRVEIFIHNLEGYKVAGAMKAHGAMPTLFSDWWAYKFEVYDAIPYGGAILWEQGLVVSYNSDNVEIARRMNLEAAKAVKYGGVPPAEALKFVTLNSAVQLGMDHRIGSLETGKDADFVVWSGDPLSTYSVCEQTWIEGRRYFDRTEDRGLRERAERERTALVQKILAMDSGGEKK